MDSNRAFKTSVDVAIFVLLICATDYTDIVIPVWRYPLLFFCFFFTKLCALVWIVPTDFTCLEISLERFQGFRMALLVISTVSDETVAFEGLPAK